MENNKYNKVDIKVDEQVIKTYELTELEGELYQRNISFDELYQELVAKYYSDYCENMNFESTMFLNKKRIPSGLAFWK